MNARALMTTALLAATLTLAACGGSGSSGAKTGTVAVVITDAPTDIYDRVEITLSEMILIGDGGQVELYNGDPITFDLLEMSEWGDLAFASQVLAGTYNKIRLQIDGITLYDGDNPGVDLENLPANGKIDLNPRGPFDVSPGVTTVVALDIDAKRAFQAVQTGQGKTQFRPIIFVDVYQDDLILPQRLVRAFGTVEAGSKDTDSFRLCDLDFISQTNSASPGSADDCIRVHADGSPGIFGEDGIQTDFASVGDNQPVTAIGWLGDTDDALAFLGLQAIVLELGGRAPGTTPGWDTTHGSVTTELTACDSDQCFEFDPSADATDADTVLTRMQPATKVYRADGVELAQTDVTTGDSGSVDGFRRQDGTTDELLAALVVLSTDVGGASAVGTVAGTPTIVGTPPDGYYIVTVTTDAGPVDVCVAADAAIAQVLVDDGVVTIVDGLSASAIQGGDRIEAYGDGTDDAPDGSGCAFLATTVILEPAP